MTLSAGAPHLQSTANIPEAVIAVLQQLDRMMTPSLDSLVNQLLPLKTTSAASAPLSAAARANVIDAVVLSNSPLLKSDGQAQFKVTLGNDQQRYELTSQLAIPVGARVQLKIAQNNLAMLLDIDKNSPPQSNPTSAQITPQTPNQQAAATVKLSAATAALTANNLTKANSTSASAGITNPQAASPAATLVGRPLIEQTLRQVLPMQEPLRTLLPLLQTVLKTPQAIPKELAVSLHHLSKQFHTAEQLQHPKPVKQAVQNSGIFFESKLAQHKPLSTSQLAENQHTNPNKPINQDIKGLLARIVPQIQSIPGQSTAPKDNTAINPASLAVTAAVHPDLPLTAHHSSSHATDKGAAQSADQSLDVLLRQLSRQILASLARTQLNQLETLSNRQPSSAEPQAPVNSWNLEIPIVHGQHIDNLELYIEERINQQSKEDDSARQKQWTVMLNFDLHHLGKMQIQLLIIDKSVSATVWSQRQETHQQVEKHVQELQTSLESVGVTVKHVDCKIGTAPKLRSPLYQQLVDVRT